MVVDADVVEVAVEVVNAIGFTNIKVGGINTGGVSDSDMVPGVLSDGGRSRGAVNVDGAGGEAFGGDVVGTVNFYFIGVIEVDEFAGGSVVGFDPEGDGLSGSRHVTDGDIIISPVKIKRIVVSKANGSGHIGRPFVTIGVSEIAGVVVAGGVSEVSASAFIKLPVANEAVVDDEVVVRVAGGKARIFPCSVVHDGSGSLTNGSGSEGFVAF